MIKMKFEQFLMSLVDLLVKICKKHQMDWYIDYATGADKKIEELENKNFELEDKIYELERRNEL